MDGYTFDSGAFQNVRQHWERLRAGLEDDLAAAQGLVGVAAPGHEPASGFVARDQNGSGEALLVSITQMRAFVDSYLISLDLAEQEYQAQEAGGVRTYRGGER